MSENHLQPSVNLSHPKAWLVSNLILCNGFKLRQNQEVIQGKKVYFGYLNVQFDSVGHVCLYEF